MITTIEQKASDVSKATKLGWTYKTELEDGIRLAYEDFLNILWELSDNQELENLRILFPHVNI